MIRDYSIYELCDKEKILFYVLGFLAVAGVLFLFYRSVIVAFGGGFAVVRLRPWFEKYMADRRMKKLSRQFKDLLYSLSASISSGRQMAEAIVESCDHLQVMYGDEEPIMVELLHMKKCLIENNESDRVLLADFARRCGEEDICNFVEVYVTCRSMGGDLERIISRTSDILTDKMNIEREIQAITSQKKLEGRLIALMPAAMLLALNLLSPAYVAPLYSGLAGRLIMTGCLAASLYGVWLMERIARVEM